jgi:hypothetical protein
MISKAPYPYILMALDMLDQSKYFQENDLICKFNSLWPKLEDLQKWISSTWKLEIKEEAFIYPCAKGFFIVEFDLSED